MADKIKIDIQMNAEDKRMLYAAFKTMPKDAQTLLRTETQKIVVNLVSQIKRAAGPAPGGVSKIGGKGQAILLAESIKANKDRVPSITVGGSRKVKVNRKKTPGSPAPTYSDLLFGTEFGASGRKNQPGTFPNGGAKFQPYSGPGSNGRGSKGYFIFPTLRRNQERIRRDYLETVYKLLRKDWGPDK